MFQTGQCIKCSCNQEHHCSRNQTATTACNYQAQPLYQAHDTIDGGSHVIGREAPDEGIELGGGRTDSQEEGDLDEDEDEAGDTL